MPTSYLSLEELKLRLDIAITDTDDEPTIRRNLEAASRKVENITGRRFQPYTATHTYTTRWADEVEVDDLLIVTSLKTLTANSNGTRTYGDTWASTDYDLEPYDAADADEPYTRIARNPAGLYAFPTERRGIEITGTWGYWLDTVTSGSALTAGVDGSTATIPVTSGADFDRLQTILVDSEQMYITAISGASLTVERGVNGTTAATHDSAAAVSIYRYPEPIVEATALYAARQFRRSDAPLGVAGSDALGTVVRITTNDTDALNYLAEYRRYRLSSV